MSEPHSPRKLNPRILLFLGSIIGVRMLFGFIAGFHSVNADEGFYLAAGRDVGSGLRPYADFFYPQMPYLAYLEAAFFALMGPGLRVARDLSVEPAALLAGVLAYDAGDRKRRVDVGCVIALAYATHALSLNYLTVLKTYGVANLLIVGAVLLVASERFHLRRAAVAGLLAAVAIGVRLPMAAVAAVLFVWCWRTDAKHAAVFAAAVVLGALPLAFLAGADPQAFWFDNVGFHALRREIIGMVPILIQKATILAKWLFLPQNAILWCLAVVGAWRGARRESCALLCAVALGALYLYATPTYLEYMVQLMPLLLIAGAPAIALLLDRRRVALAVAVVWFASLAVALRPAAPGSARAEKIELWNLQTVDSVAQYLRENSEPTDKVLSWWEGYPVLAQRPGFKEVGFWHSNAAKKLSVEDRRRYHVGGTDDVRALIESGEPRLIVTPEDEWAELRPAILGKYRVAKTFGTLQVFERQPGNGNG